MAWGKNLRCHIKGVMESRKEDFWRSSFEIEKCLVGGVHGGVCLPFKAHFRAPCSAWGRRGCPGNVGESC